VLCLFEVFVCTESGIGKSKWVGDVIRSVCRVDLWLRNTYSNGCDGAGKFCTGCSYGTLRRDFFLSCLISDV
jgi:hypothetical protein